MLFHLIANSHLDPVWLWDWREGLNEALTTVRTVLNLMDENPMLTYIRGESVLYQHIEETDPTTFRRIAAYVRKGRWDVVGGSYLQPDTNLAGIETLARQYTEGLRYFEKRFGLRPTVAWQADSFGHSAGLPEVLRAAGINSFAFTRPDGRILPFPEPAFWWEGPSGARVLAYRPLAGWYGTQREDATRRLDDLLEAAGKSSLQNVACFYGLGNHGGGPTRRHLLEIRTWAENHPDVKVVHSGLHQFFDSLRKELLNRPRLLPVHRGELNFCLRGSYSSMARFKALYRRGENLLVRAERTDALIAGSLGTEPANLGEAWRGILFNSFHDILPGTSIERAMEDQTMWMGSVIHEAQKTELRALNHLARKVDTRVADHPSDHPSAVAALVWNPHATPFRGHVELEACLDYRPLYRYQGRPAEVPLRVLGPEGKSLPFQEIAVENGTSVNVPWRKRVLVPVTLPSFGWNVLEFGWVEDAAPPSVSNSVRSGPDWIKSGDYTVKSVPGKRGVFIYHRDQPLLGREGLTAATFRDPWGTWGGMTEETDSILLHSLGEEWTVAATTLLESGPERAALWTRLAGKHSRIDLVFSVSRNRPAVDVQARVLWTEQGARLKLSFPVGDKAEFEVPGATVTRPALGEVPGGKWVSIPGKFGFASDSLYNFDCHDGKLQATLVRGTPYATEFPGSEVVLHRPTGDLGEFKFQFLLTAETAELPRLARELEQPPLILLVPPKSGSLPRQGSLGNLKPASLQLLAFKPAEAGHGFVLRVQSPLKKAVRASFCWIDAKGKSSTVELGLVTGRQILSWLLEPTTSGWKATAVDLSESPLASGPDSKGK